MVEKSHPKVFSERLLYVAAKLLKVLKEKLNLGLSACDSEIPRLAFTQNLKLSGLSIWLLQAKCFIYFPMVKLGG